MIQAKFALCQHLQMLARPIANRQMVTGKLDWGLLT
jgi:hypothetical protein